MKLKHQCLLFAVLILWPSAHLFAAQPAAAQSAAQSAADAGGEKSDTKANSEALAPQAEETALIKAAKTGNLDAVKDLIVSAMVNARDKRGNTALHHAAQRGYPQIAAFLIQHKADKEIKNARGATPLTLANHRLNLITTALATADEEDKPKIEEMQKNLSNVITVLNKVYEEMPTRGRVDSVSQHDAVAPFRIKTKKPSLLDAILAGKAMPLDSSGAVQHNSKEDAEPQMPLATQKELFDAAQKGSLQVLQKFAADKVNFGVQDAQGNTPLHVALLNDAPNATIIVIIKATKGLDKTNSLGNTPLHIAAQKLNKAIAEYLIDGLADRKPVNKAGETPLAIVRKIKATAQKQADLDKATELIVYLEGKESELPKL